MPEREQHKFAKHVSKILKDNGIEEAMRDEWGNPFITDEDAKRLPKSLVINHTINGLHRITAKRK